MRLQSRMRRKTSMLQKELLPTVTWCNIKGVRCKFVARTGTAITFKTLQSVESGLLVSLLDPGRMFQGATMENKSRTVTMSMHLKCPRLSRPLPTLSRITLTTLSWILPVLENIINLDGLQTILFQPSPSFKGIIYTDPCSVSGITMKPFRFSKVKRT